MKERLAAILNWLPGADKQSSAQSGRITELGVATRVEQPAPTQRARAAKPGHLWPRWIFLRALGLIYLSAFYSLYFQIKGLIGPEGILPAGDYLQAIAAAPDLHAQRLRFAPTLLWISSSDHALMLLCWAGLIASALVVVNVWPRGMLLGCFICFLSFIAAAQDFASYQSDGMLLEAGFISLFFAPPGLWPGLGLEHPPWRLSTFLLQWEWFRIYFESGAGKWLGHDPSWRNLTAMDQYYQNGPLPTWIGYYVQHFPHWFQASSALFTLIAEIFLVWMLFLPRRFRIVCFCIVTPFQIGIILTANYAFLNYLVLALGFLLLDDRFVEWIVPDRIRRFAEWKPKLAAVDRAHDTVERWRKAVRPMSLTVSAICLGLVFYVATAQLLWMFFSGLPIPQKPVSWVEPFRIANAYGLFERMTWKRYEIEFQGSNDGKTWVAYPFRYKPQDVNKAPGIYAPYQPRFEWNLWFASLDSVYQNRWVVWTEERLLQNSPDVLQLFAYDPFPRSSPPKRIRVIMYQYWFTTPDTKRKTGDWWQRELLSEYAPELIMQPNGRPAALDTPLASPPPP